MPVINSLKIVCSFCACGLKHFQLMDKKWCKKAGSNKRQCERLYPHTSGLH